MRIGPRRPSPAKRIAARTSWARFVRHSLGLKAPRGWGWLTDPRRAAYNRVYSRVTFDPVRVLSQALRRPGGVPPWAAAVGVGIAVAVLIALFTR